MKRTAVGLCSEGQVSGLDTWENRIKPVYAADVTDEYTLWMHSTLAFYWPPVYFSSWHRIVADFIFIPSLSRKLSSTPLPPPCQELRKRKWCVLYIMFMSVDLWDFSECVMWVWGRGIKKFYSVQKWFLGVPAAANLLLFSVYSCMWLLFKFCIFMRNELRCFFYCLLNVLLILLWTQIEWVHQLIFLSVSSCRNVLELNRCEDCPCKQRELISC